MKRRPAVLISLVVLFGVASGFVYVHRLNQALCLAASRGETATVERLLRRGANPNAVGVVPAPGCGSDSDPLHALSHAVYNTSSGCTEYMGPNVKPYFPPEYTDTVAALLRAGADVNVREEDGLTVQMLAHSPRMLKLLLVHGVQADLRGKFGMTPLMYYAHYGNKEEVKALLAAGADINARDDRGTSVLGYAQPWDDPQDKGEREHNVVVRQTAEFLKKHGARR